MKRAALLLLGGVVFVAGCGSPPDAKVELARAMNQADGKALAGYITEKELKDSGLTPEKAAEVIETVLKERIQPGAEFMPATMEGPEEVKTVVGQLVTKDGSVPFNFTVRTESGAQKIRPLLRDVFFAAWRRPGSNNDQAFQDYQDGLKANRERLEALGMRGFVMDFPTGLKFAEWEAVGQRLAEIQTANRAAASAMAATPQ